MVRIEQVPKSVRFIYNVLLFSIFKLIVTPYFKTDPIQMDIIKPNGSNSYVPMDGGAFKLDAEQGHTLLSVADYYRQVEGHVNKVRPWIQSDYATKPSMCLITQFALFKCMHANCIFSTDDEDIWTAHMVDHIKLMDVFTEHGMLTNEVRCNQIKFRECPYCPTEAGSNPETTWHIEEHRRSIFQCAYCFYRTIEMDCMVLHYSQNHATERREILMTADAREFGQKEEEALAEGEQYVEQFQCRE